MLLCCATHKGAARLAGFTVDEADGALLQDLQTGTAWSLKGTFRRFRSYRSPSRAIRFFSHWEEVAEMLR